MLPYVFTSDADTTTSTTRRPRRRRPACFRRLILDSALWLWLLILSGCSTDALLFSPAPSSDSLNRQARIRGRWGLLRTCLSINNDTNHQDDLSHHQSFRKRGPFSFNSSENNITSNSNRNTTTNNHKHRPRKGFVHAFDKTQWMTLPSRAEEIESSRKQRVLMEDRNTTATFDASLANVTSSIALNNSTINVSDGIDSMIAPARTPPKPKRKSTQPANPFVTFPENKLRDYYAWMQQQQQQGTQQLNHAGSLEFLKRKKPDDVITVADLELMLRQQQEMWSRSATRNLKDEQSSVNINVGNKAGRNNPQGRSGDGSTKMGIPISASSAVESGREKRSRGVAFPQPSVLSYKSVQWGATTSGCFLGMVVAVSMAPNLWLMGALVGGLYGYETGQGLKEEPHTVPNNIVATILIRMGRKLAKAYLKVRDSLQTFWFMYKTGQLSYEYYQRYAELDSRFAIQQKVDAWNARFVQGKISFDKWERENEIGRKALAALRTAWLVEERSLRKNRLLKRNMQGRRSKYRLIQLMYDATYTLGQLLGSVWSSVTAGQSRFKEFLRGVMTSSNLSAAAGAPQSSRVGSILAALVVVNLAGALFTISPTFLAVAAGTVGFVWPTWISELAQRSAAFVEEARARGRGEIANFAPVTTKTESSATNNMTVTKMKEQASEVLNSWYNFISEATAKPRASIKAAATVDKSRYHYFRRKDGKRRYYRVGVPWWTSSVQQNRKKGVQQWPW